MAESGGSSRVSNVGIFPPSDDTNPLKTLYPMVNEEDTPLPRSWSNKDKYNYIGLSQNNLRVHYKGHGKTHKDAASVRATHPIPAACGLYYFEIRIVSKGRDGYMGIGLSVQGVSMNRLPGWDMNSYGYHGDDGHSFCSSGTGQPYGPTFTTNDVIGCGVNLVDRTCFYTKNGVLLGTAFKDLPKKLYPTVGLQTPGEVVDANFGTSGPFLYDLRYKLQEVRESVRKTILEHPITLPEPAVPAGDKGKWADIMNRMVSGYLVHHGYCCTAEAFSRATKMDFNEEITSIKNRQRISGLIMAGDVGGSIACVDELYPNLLKDNPNLLFMLKVRQFIEIVRGTEQQQSRSSTTSPSRVSSNGSSITNGTNDTVQTTQDKIPKHTSVIQSTKSVLSSNNKNNKEQSATGQQTEEEQLNQRNSDRTSQASQLMAPLLAAQRGAGDDDDEDDDESSSRHVATDREYIQRQSSSSPTTTVPSASSPLIRPTLSSLAVTADVSFAAQQADSDTEMECVDDVIASDGVVGNDVRNVPLPPPLSSVVSTSPTVGSSSSGSSMNGVSNGFSRHDEEDMIVDDDSTQLSTNQRNGVINGTSCLPSNDSSKETTPTARRRDQVERVLSFGRELQTISQQLKKAHGKNKTNKRMLQDAFSLLAYNEPSCSPVGWQLDTAQREPVCQALNSAILEAQNLPARPALEICASHTQQLVSLMSKSGLGASAFTHINHLLQYDPKPFVPENSYAMPDDGDTAAAKDSSDLTASDSGGVAAAAATTTTTITTAANVRGETETRTGRGASAKIISRSSRTSLGAGCSSSITGKRSASSFCTSSDFPPSSSNFPTDLSTSTRLSSVITPPPYLATSGTVNTLSSNSSNNAAVLLSRNIVVPVASSSVENGQTRIVRAVPDDYDEESMEDSIASCFAGASAVATARYEEDFILKTSSNVDFQVLGLSGSREHNPTTSRDYSTSFSGAGGGAPVSGSDGDFYYDYTSSNSGISHTSSVMTSGAVASSTTLAGGSTSDASVLNSNVTSAIISSITSTSAALSSANAALAAASAASLGEEEPMALDAPHEDLQSRDHSGPSSTNSSSTTSASSSTTSSTAALASSQQDGVDDNMSESIWLPSTRQ